MTTAVLLLLLVVLLWTISRDWGNGEWGRMKIDHLSWIAHAHQIRREQLFYVLNGTNIAKRLSGEKSKTIIDIK